MKKMVMRSWAVCQSGSLSGRLITSSARQVTTNRHIVLARYYLSLADGCDQCFLRNFEKPLESHYSDAVNVQGAKPEDIVFILSRDSAGVPDAIPAMQFLNQRFPGVDLRFNLEFEGMEKPKYSISPMAVFRRTP